MNLKTPRTAFEALYAEILGDLTRIIERVEALPGVLDAASERFRISAGEFNDRAGTALSAQLEQKSREVAAEVTEGIQTVVQKHVKEAFEKSVRADVNELVEALKAATSEQNKTMKNRVKELVVVSFGSALCTALLVIVALKIL